MNSVFITGIGRGIGKELALKFLQDGSQVYGTSTSGTTDYTHENLTCIELDLSSPESISDCIQKIQTLGLRFNLLINNAGILLDENEKMLVPDLLRGTLEVNLIGTADFTERMLPLIEKGGHIVMLSSSAGSIGRTGNTASRYPSQYPAYKISKAALNMYVRTLSLRMEPESITVSSVHPGWARTDMGGQEANISPEEAAETVYKIAISKPETGKFWNSEGELPW